MVLAAERTDVNRAKPSYAVIDCDIHPNLVNPAALDPYLSARWVEHRKGIGGRGFSGSYYPRASPNASRIHARLKNAKSKMPAVSSTPSTTRQPSRCNVGRTSELAAVTRSGRMFLSSTAYSFANRSRF